jgi:hypothetical protein
MLSVGTNMALIARPHLPSSPAAPAVAAGALLVGAAALAALLSTVYLPSGATQGLPTDWLQRGAWLAVQALVGLGVACGVMALVGRRGEPTR